MDPAQAAAMLAQMDPSKAAAVLASMDPSEAVGMLMSAGPEAAARMLLMMPPGDLVNLLLLMDVQAAASILNHLEPSKSADGLSYAMKLEKKSMEIGALPKEMPMSSTGMRPTIHIGQVVACMFPTDEELDAESAVPKPLTHPHGSASMLNCMSAQEVASILETFPKGMGRWTGGICDEKIPKKNVAGVQPIKWVVTKGLSLEILMNLETDFSMEVLEAIAAEDDTTIEDMISTADVYETAEALNAMDVAHARRFLACARASQKAAFLEKMDLEAASRFIIYDWEKGGGVDALLRMSSHHQQDKIIKLICKAAKAPDQPQEANMQFVKFAKEVEATRDGWYA